MKASLPLFSWICLSSIPILVPANSHLLYCKLPQAAALPTLCAVCDRKAAHMWKKGRWSAAANETNKWCSLCRQLSEPYFSKNIWFGSNPGQEQLEPDATQWLFCHPGRATH